MTTPQPTPQDHPTTSEPAPTCTCENGGIVIAWDVNGKIETDRAYDVNCPVHGLRALLK